MHGSCSTLLCLASPMLPFQPCSLPTEKCQSAIIRLCGSFRKWESDGSFISVAFHCNYDVHANPPFLLTPRCPSISLPRDHCYSPLASLSTSLTQRAFLHFSPDRLCHSFPFLQFTLLSAAVAVASHSFFAN
jgi:hypothetical protein